VQPPVFYGEYDLTIDDKNRVLVPSEVRKRFSPEHGSAFFLIVGTTNRVPWMFPAAYYEFLAAQRRPTMLPDRETSDFDRMTFALASRLEWDKQGRILIPARTLDRTVIKDEKEVTLIGNRDHVELWPRKAWEAEREALIARSAEITLRAQD